VQETQIQAQRNISMRQIVDERYHDGTVILDLHKLRFLQWAACDAFVRFAPSWVCGCVKV
jgi:hypothetical protein